MVKKIGFILILAFIGYGLFTLGDIKATASFKGKLDSLDKVNDSLVTENEEDSYKIAVLQVQDSILTYNIQHQKTRVIKIKEIVEIEKNKIDNFSEQEIVSYLNQRYPKDTITNPLPVAQPVLTFVAKDLAAYDGAKHEIVIKDSVIAIQESRITLKDSTIGLYANKEVRFKSIISNQDLKINQWSKQYDNLNLNYKKLQVKNKFQKIGSYIIIGGLAYTLLVK
jgi:fructose-1,6-bisphosphatase/inositol monophosphatase family enzyme